MNLRDFFSFTSIAGFTELAKRLRGAFATLLVLIAFSPLGNAQSLQSLPPEASMEVQASIKAHLATTGTNFDIKHIFITPMSGVYHVELEDGRSLFSSPDGKYLIAGDLYQAQKNGMLNLSEAIRNFQRKGMFEELVNEDTINFSPKGKPKATLYVFTDVDCGYCQKLHNDVAQLNERGIELRYLAFPRQGVGSPGYNKLVSAWCAKDRQSAMTKLKRRGKLANANCENPVQSQYLLGQKLGVGGTPTMFTAEGMTIPGYMPPEALAGRLGLEPKL